ncbi:MAG: glycosyltransferase [Butyrivibrio sp.]|nr:glycosyltransferase [Butyrivibrio sp.]
MSNVAVSVIVPVYNVEKYLEQCVDSLLNQTFSDMEIILVDDGSTDGSGAICDRYGKLDNVTVLHQENQGVSVARNNALKIAKGKWLLFVDADDYVEPTFCEITVNTAESTGSDIVMFSYYTEKKNKTTESYLIDLPFGDITGDKEYLEAKTISQYYGKEVLNSGVSAGAVVGKIVNSDLIRSNDIRFPKGILRGEDSVFWLSAFEVARKIYYISALLYHYRQYGEGITSAKRFIPNCEERMFGLMDEYDKFIAKYNKKSSAINDALDLRVLQMMMWVVKHEICNHDAGYSLSQRAKVFKKMATREDVSRALKRADYSNFKDKPKMVVFYAKKHMYHLFIIAYELRIFREKVNYKINMLFKRV